MSNTNSYVVWTLDGKDEPNISLNMTAMIEVISSTSFYFQFTTSTSWMWFPPSSGRNTMKFIPGNTGRYITRGGGEGGKGKKKKREGGRGYRRGGERREDVISSIEWP